jgi:hypothetical protein
MKKKTLLETNPYLKDPAEREAGIVLNVATSSAIEGVSLPSSVACLKPERIGPGRLFP